MRISDNFRSYVIIKIVLENKKIVKRFSDTFISSFEEITADNTQKADVEHAEMCHDNIKNGDCKCVKESRTANQN